ncbi:hypothetical protein [Labedella endophytica]|uniref:Uncharacterized protein n=1 Tax=Labedella endophytica TaxID=1523160 RepID=A0A3S0X7X2_9MICO|nr:hypothetical protein [Labedella endophytica]RUR01450.1 hypothetical protein ELQ94_08105 [Labedella endophytica]
MAIAGFAIAALVLVPTARPTEAVFTDSETATGTLTAFVVPRPTLSSTCTINPGLLGATPSITIEWTLPAGYASTDVRYGVGATPTTLQPVTANYVTTPLSGARYRTVFSGGLLSGLLGGSASVGVRIQDTPKNSWLSRWATATGGSGLAGINAYCTVNP